MLNTERTSTPILATVLSSRFRNVALLLSIVLLLAADARAQNSEQPQRGFHPGGTFALSDIEKINTVNGNMILNFPLATLPTGRGGLSASINLLYNSKLWDTHVEYVPDLSNQISPQNFLGLSEDGGWRYGTRYDIRIINRNDGVDDPPQYPDPHAIFIWKVQVIFPDGGIHEFRPHGQADYYDDGFFSVYPPQCGGGSGPVSYYSTDGTYMRLVFTPCNGWTLSMPDGTRVENPANGDQRVYDRNNNYIEHVYVENYNNTGMPAGVIRDQLGRSIATQYDPATQEDLIISTGFNNQTLTTRVKWKTITVNKSYETSCAGCSQTRGGTSIQTLEMPITVLDRITLPAQSGGLTYVFGYNADTANPSLGWGEVNSITLPTSAQSTYTWELDGSPFGHPPRIDWVLKNSPASKTLNYHQEFDGSSTPATEVWQYSINDSGSSIVAPDGGTTSLTFGNTSYQSAANGLVFTSVGPDGTVVENIWQQNLPFGLNGLVQNNPYVKTEFTSIKNALGQLTLTAIKDFNYDKNGNVTQVKEYDWVSYSSVPRNNGFPTGIPPGAPLKRVTTNTYERPVPDASGTSDCGDCYWYLGAPNVRNAVASNEVSDGYTPSSRLELSYDNPVTTANVTETRRWDSSKGAYSNQLNAGNSISVSSEYNSYGQPTLATDARGYRTEFFYGNVGGVVDLYPTQIKTAFQTSVQRTETREYDFYTGLVTRVTDADNNVSMSTSYDPFGRPILVRAAEGKPEESRTSTEYSDLNRRVIVRADLDTVGDGKLVSIQHYDQLGHVRLTRQLEDAATQDAYDETTGIKVQTRHMFSGQNSFALTSNPYRAATSGGATAETTMGWTRSKSDSGRVIEVQTFAGAGLPAPWADNTAGTGTVTTTYDANQITVSDQAGRQRKSVSDALGRLVQIYEAPNDPSSNYLTSYSYGALDNLQTVAQDTQARTFSYDSLKRLQSAVNPESGPVNYQYDNNANLLVKTDARGVSSHYEYDERNRLLRRWYNGSNSVTAVNHNDPALPSDVGASYEVTYSYDSGCPTCNSKGKLTSVSSTVSTYSYTAYDAMGRVRNGVQTIGTQPYTLGYTYDLAGHVKTITYPSNHAVTYNYDSAGRLADKDANNLAFTGNLGQGGSARTYASSLTYSSFGGLQEEKLATTTPIYHKQRYNARGQLWDMRASTISFATDPANGDRGAIVNYYSNNFVQGGSGADNNGNLLRQEIYIPGSNFFQDTFEYDWLNRLTSITEKLNGSGNPSFKQTYLYDRWGNRRINGDQAETFGGVNNLAFDVENAVNGTNRLYAPGDLPLPMNQRQMRYDAAGNLNHDSYTGQGIRVNDAENRIVEAVGNGQAQYYSYDGDGRRVKRKVNQVETWQVYGPGGELLAEYTSNGTQLSKEYGYRNGELLITATVASGWGAPPTIEDNPLNDPQNPENQKIKAIHITQLRAAINALRSHYNYPNYQWVKPTASGGAINNSVFVSWEPIDEMRTALNEALGVPSTPYAEGLAVNQPILAVHVQELRNRVLDAWQSGGGVDIRWLVADHLGTPRMIFDQSGSLANVSRHDYLPFGEELFLGTGGRTTAQGYTSIDNLRQKFTSKERDNETGLDYFGARYLSSAQGRFISVDPALTSASVTTPQSWNRYAYSFNNPLKYIDPTGAWNWSAELGGSASDEELRSKAGKDKKALKAANKIIDQRNLFRNGLNDARGAGPRSDDPAAVARAVTAYGSEGDSNGVTVTFGTVSDGSAAQVGPGANGALAISADGTATAQVLVTISNLVTNSNALAQAIGHEGWHVADRQSFANYLTGQIHGAGGLANFVGTPLETRAFNSPYNRNVQTTELGAYIVSGLIAQGRDALGRNFPNSNFNGHEVWNNSWSAAERPGLRAVGAFEHVTTSPTYANKLKNRQFPQ